MQSNESKRRVDNSDARVAGGLAAVIILTLE